MQRILKVASHGKCNEKLSQDPLRLHLQSSFYQDFLSILQVIYLSFKEVFWKPRPHHYLIHFLVSFQEDAARSSTPNVEFLTTGNTRPTTYVSHMPFPIPLYINPNTYTVQIPCIVITPPSYHYSTFLFQICIKPIQGKY